VTRAGEPEGHGDPAAPGRRRLGGPRRRWWPAARGGLEREIAPVTAPPPALGRSFADGTVARGVCSPAARSGGVTGSR